MARLGRTVYATRQGSRYHVTDRCPGLAAGQQGAAAYGQRTYPLERLTERDAQGRGLGPCKQCAPR
jgi:hypothetical protein